MKIIHIELSHKWAKIVVFKILGQDMFSKSVWILYNESITFLIPKNCILILGILLVIVRLSNTYINDFVGLHQKIGYLLETYLFLNLRWLLLIQNGAFVSHLLYIVWKLCSRKCPTILTHPCVNAVALTISQWPLSAT